MIRTILDNLCTNYYEMAAVILFFIGFMTLLLHRNIIKKIIGMNIMDSATYLFLAANGFIEGKIAPFATVGEAATVEKFVNPIPAGLVLTGIVVSVSVTAVMLSLSIRLYKRYHTLDLDEIYILSRHELEDR